MFALDHPERAMACVSAVCQSKSIVMIMRKSPQDQAWGLEQLLMDLQHSRSLIPRNLALHMQVAQEAHLDKQV